MTREEARERQQALRTRIDAMAQPFVKLKVYDPDVGVEYPFGSEILLPAAAVELLLVRVNALEQRVRELEQAVSVPFYVDRIG